MLVIANYEFSAPRPLGEKWGTGYTLWLHHSDRVPGHTGIRGEREDRQTSSNLGSGEVPTGPEPILMLPEANFELAVKPWKNNKRKHKWQETDQLKHSKHMLGDDAVYTRSKTLVKKPRLMIKMIVEVSTDHGTLNAYLYRAGRASTQECALY